MAITATTLTACKKDDVPAPLPTPVGTYAIKVRAAITVGDVVYDSIPATVTVTSWDNKGVQQQHEVQLEPGTNTVHLAKGDVKYRLQLSKWGLTDERTIMANEVNETTTYTLGGTKAAKKLTEELGYSYQEGAFQLYNKFQYSYDAQGRLKEVANYFTNSDATTPHLELYSIDRFIYNGSRLEKIETIDKRSAGDPVLGYNTFSWTAEGKLVGISYGDQSEAATCHMEYGSQEDHELVRVNYIDGNAETGTRAELKFKGGNRVEEKIFIPNYLTSTRRYTYDHNINPYVHMKWPQVNFSNQSKNNVVEETPDFAAVTLKCAYSYDADGYVTEVVKSETRATGTKLVFKRVYTY